MDSLLSECEINTPVKSWSWESEDMIQDRCSINAVRLKGCNSGSMSDYFLSCRPEGEKCTNLFTLKVLLLLVVVERNQNNTRWKVRENGGEIQPEWSVFPCVPGLIRGLGKENVTGFPLFMAPQQQLIIISGMYHLDLFYIECQQCRV